MTNEIKRSVFGMCRSGLHSECIGGYESKTTVDGFVLPAEECTCECGHPALKEREATS